MKRCLDLGVAGLGLAALWWLLLLAIVAARIDTRATGLFRQRRVGQYGRVFDIYKVRTMRDRPDVTTTVTQSHDPRITKLGRVLRRFKIDELPQLWNVLIGDMSLVGPRPDVPGYADRLEGRDRIILSVRPGITGPATLRYRDEEALLAKADDPEDYNRTVIFPDKVRINRDYVENYSFRKDLIYILKTVIG